MTQVLAIDTSHMKGSAAVLRDGEILCEILFDASDTHSATLMPAVDVCLENARVNIADMDLFAVVSGPGSFTGLRIGFATVKAFAAIGRRPVAAVPSLEVLAAAFPFARSPVLPLIDARRGEVYAGCYDTSDGSPHEIMAPLSVAPERIGETLAGAGVSSSVICCGTGLLRYRELLMPLVPRGTEFAGTRWAVPSAALLAALALRVDPVPYDELAGLEPLYIRPPDARLPGEARLKAGGGR